MDDDLTNAGAHYLSGSAGQSLTADLANVEAKGVTTYFFCTWWATRRLWQRWQKVVAVLVNCSVLCGEVRPSCWLQV